MNNGDNGWADFTHTTRNPNITARELLERFREFQRFIKGLPRKELVARGWIKTIEDDSPLESVFFDLPLLKQPMLFRKSAAADENLLAVWQARARGRAEYLCLAEQRASFRQLTKEGLRKIARLSVDPQVVRKMPRILSELGIILVYVQALPSMKADGAIFLLSTGQPVIAMSLRFPRLDYFWFTLLHELAHLILHLDQLKDPVFFDVEGDENDRAERAANRLAKDSIADSESWRSCAAKYDTTDRAVQSYAATQGVHPSLIAGLLRKETGNYKRYSSIINEHDVRQIIFEQ